ncbi:MAG: glutamine-hydrolyzing GMP synthase [Christensenellales bacterium]|jgi:GMP synthase (glutamine-hydrolysing)
MPGDMILVVDFGGTQVQSTARKLRGDRIYCEIVKPEAAPQMLADARVKGVLLVGEPAEETPIDKAIYDAGRPILAMGACARMLCVSMGGTSIAAQIEARTAMITFAESPLFEELVESDRYFERVDMLELPEGFEPIAFSAGGVVPAFADESRNIYGLQFYAETNDPDGLRILSNFARTVCGCDPWWTMEAFAQLFVERMQAEFPDGTALLAISGGVDSSVCAALMHRAIGDRLRCVYVNTGLMRLGETELVKQVFLDELGLDFIVADAADGFLARLGGIIDADQKREVVADEMMRVIAAEAKRRGQMDCLVQGTIYPDILSAGSADSGAWRDRRTLMDHIEFRRMIEPLRMLFKDEVRALGEVLGLPKEIISRQPFPEAGLAVRCMGEVTREKLDILGRADAIFREEIADAGLDRRIWQYFAVLTDIRTHGMREAQASLEYAIALRAVSSQDAISAFAYRLPYDLLERVVARITSEIRGVNRVLYDVTGKPPAMIEWE